MKSARNLGVIFENDLRMHDYIKNICRSASYALYKIGRIWHFLNNNNDKKPQKTTTTTTTKQNQTKTKTMKH